jgi:NAD(P)-dependent dehydrogenase (short-subunit alcohol dehydrogenase family)
MKLPIRTLSLGAAGALAWYALSHRRSVMSFAGKVVVITGGSRGLGLELARRWCREGASVAFCARSAEEVERAVEELSLLGDVLGLVCDITEPEQIQNFVAAVLHRWGRIDVLVNNAGIIQVGPMDCMSHADYEQALATHFWGPLMMTESVLPTMHRQGSGRIVNIASIGGRVSMPHLLPYTASKFALVGWSEGLAAELRKFNIFVTTVTPGLMRTGSARRATFKGRHRAEYAWFSIGASLPLVATNSALAAERIVEGCRQGTATVMVSGFSHLAARSHGLWPGLTTRLMTFVDGCLPRSTPRGRRAFSGWQSESEYSPSWLTTLNDRAAVRNHEV